MIKLAVFDLDNTLAPIGGGISESDVSLMKKIQDRGVRIAICSGKPTYYLCGFIRQTELKDVILIGENGAAIQFGVDLPPKVYHILAVSEKARKTIKFLDEEIKKRIPDAFFQPNQSALTIFPRNDAEFAAVTEILDENKDRIEDVDIYRHIDSFDITPFGINKYNGIKTLGEMLGISPADTVAVGDGINDYPMFDYAGVSVGVNVKEAERVDANFANPTQALTYILEDLC